MSDDIPADFFVGPWSVRAITNRRGEVMVWETNNLYCGLVRGSWNVMAKLVGYNSLPVVPTALQEIWARKAWLA